MQLRCTTAGTTSASTLNCSSNNVGDSITDGSVVWAVESLGTQFASVSHAHSASDITSGVISIANGGTGATTASDACANIGAVRSVDGIRADDNGNVNTIVTKGDNYIRYESGLQICWGQQEMSNNYTLTFPQPFANTNYGITLIHVDGADTTVNYIIGSGYTTTNCIVKINNAYTPKTSYIIIGTWK